MAGILVLCHNFSFLSPCQTLANLDKANLGKSSWEKGRLLSWDKLLERETGRMHQRVTLRAGKFALTCTSCTSNTATGHQPKCKDWHCTCICFSASVLLCCTELFTLNLSSWQFASPTLFLRQILRKSFAILVDGWLKSSVQCLCNACARRRVWIVDILFNERWNTERPKSKWMEAHCP